MQTLCIETATLSYVRQRIEKSAGQAKSEPERGVDARPDREYEPPAITDLGTLHDLTLGGTVPPDDGFGGAGGTGSIPP